MFFPAIGCWWCSSIMFKRNRSHVCSFKRLYESKDLQIGARRHVHIGTLTASVLGPRFPRKIRSRFHRTFLPTTNIPSLQWAFGRHGKDHKLIYPSPNWEYMSETEILAKCSSRGQLASTKRSVGSPGWKKTEESNGTWTICMWASLQFTSWNMGEQTLQNYMFWSRRRI